MKTDAELLREAVRLLRDHDCPESGWYDRDAFIVAYDARHAEPTCVWCDYGVTHGSESCTGEKP